MLTVKTDQAEPYLDVEGLTLIPLHCYNTIVDRHGNKEKAGKRPLHTNWTTRDFDNEETLALAQEDNNNVGVRLDSTWMVFDVDPRHGGKEGLAKLKADFPNLAAVINEAPTVRTGGGGRHYYVRKPEGFKVLDTIEAYAGVEFKSQGRQVVAAGSIHPETQRFYTWDTNPDRLPLTGAPDCPADFLNIIKRAPRAATGEGGGDYTPADIERMLSKLKASDYDTDSKWRPMMMACHHASAGEARDEFIAWSTSDPNYAHDADIIGRRWDSCDKAKDGAVTFGTLRKELYAKKAAGVIPPKPSNDFGDASTEYPDYDDEFEFETRKPKPKARPKAKPSAADSEFEGDDDDDDDDDDGIEPPEDDNRLVAINRVYCAVMENGKFRIMRQVYDSMLERKAWERIQPPDFHAFFANQRIETGEGNKTQAASQAWMQWPGRRTYDGVVFNPEASQDQKGVLNLWTGWGVEPSPDGSWELMQQMVLECLCAGDRKLYDYVIKWCAYMFQHPGSPAESCIVFKGAQGIGKGTFGSALLKLCGRHSVHVQSPDHVTGRFNAHLRDCIFLFSDEAIKPYDKKAESKLKGLVTEKSLEIEGKGVDLVTVVNLTHVMMASNEHWVLPIGEFERRYVVANCSDAWRGQFEKWQALKDQMGAGGYERMLFDLLRMPLGDFHPRLNEGISQVARAEQQLQSMSPLQTFLFNAAWDGVWPGATVDDFADWSKGRIRVFTEDFKADFDLWAKSQNIHPGASGRANKLELAKQINAIVPVRPVRERVPEGSAVRAAPSDRRAWAYDMPSLNEFRAAFDKLLRVKQVWPDVTDDEFDFG